VQSMVSASSLRFAGLRSTYRRDGFGAEMVAEVPAEPLGEGVAPPVPAAQQSVAAQGGAVRASPAPPHRPAPPPFSEMPFAPVSVLVRFDGDSLEEVLNSRHAVVEPHDPFEVTEVAIGGQKIPLAAN